MNRSESFLNNIDWVLVSLYLILCIIGVAFIYSTGYNTSDTIRLFDFGTVHGQQILWLIVSLVVAFVVVIIDFKFYSNFAYIIYGAIMLLLASVLFLGVEINGSKSWFALGGFRFQPAELAKFATCLALAKVLSDINIDLRTLNGKLKAGTILAIPMALILLQGDVGSAIVFSSLIFVLHREGLESAFLVIGFGLILFSILALLYPPFLLLYFYAGILCVFIFYNRLHKYPIIAPTLSVFALISVFILYNKYLLPLNSFTNSYAPLFILSLVVLIVGFVLHYKKKKWITPFMAILFVVGVYTFSVSFIFNNVLKQHHRDRINLILGKIEDQSGAGYNLYQSKVAIGSGGLTGKGYLQGTQTMLNYVPEQSTDFIFTSIAEQFGFIGSFVLILLFTLFLLRIIQVSERQRSAIARIYGYGVASILFIHFFVNIGMTIGIVPVIGIPLPFISKGGSSLLSFTILLFVLIKFDTERLSFVR
ncbi:MAG: rod shape-determining protein RodA [Chitinophagales bacterium]|nr:rod shape-determining protein RodA [Bacteroidota bacterium]MCB9225882.1 rod shape-determining protein RodA [Chitinophagales bacterium]